MEKILESNTHEKLDDKTLINIISLIEKNNLLINNRYTQNKIYISPIRINSAINKCTIQSYRDVYKTYFKEYDRKNNFNMNCIILNIFYSASLQPIFYDCFTELLHLMYTNYSHKEKKDFFTIISKVFVHLFITYKNNTINGSSYDKFCFQMKEKKRIIGSYIIFTLLSKKISKMKTLFDIQFANILKKCQKLNILTEVLINIIPVLPKNVLKKKKVKIIKCYQKISMDKKNKRNSLLLLNVIEKYLN